MEKIGTIIWYVLRVLILLVLLGAVVGMGVCGVAIYMLGGSSHTFNTGEMAFLTAIAVATLILAWVFWIVLRALFFKKPSNDEP
ncbi:MAG: hypothetical protein U1F34_02580 [Gammaproteobacteria bacterium]